MPTAIEFGRFQIQPHRRGVFAEVPMREVGCCATLFARSLQLRVPPNDKGLEPGGSIVIGRMTDHMGMFEVKGQV